MQKLYDKFANLTDVEINLLLFLNLRKNLTFGLLSTLVRRLLKAMMRNILKQCHHSKILVEFGHPENTRMKARNWINESFFIFIYSITADVPIPR